MGKSIKQKGAAPSSKQSPKAPDAVFLKIQEIIAGQLKKKPDEITLNAHMQTELGADSLDALEFVFQIEDAFDIKVTEEEAKSMATVNDIVKLVTKKVKDTPKKPTKK